MQPTTVTTSLPLHSHLCLHQIHPWTVSTTVLRVIHFLRFHQQIQPFIWGPVFNFSSKQQQLMELQSGLCIWQLHAPHCKHVTTCHVTSHGTTGHVTLHMAVLSNVVIKCKGRRGGKRDRERELLAGNTGKYKQTDKYNIHTHNHQYNIVHKIQVSGHKWSHKIKNNTSHQ